VQDTAQMWLKMHENGAVHVLYDGTWNIDAD